MTEMENIILVGFMGTGKTAVAREISRILGFPHVETDKLIAEDQGMSIPEIFEKKGEPYFRQLEYETIASIDQRFGEKVVICTGGGLPMQERNQRVLRELGFVVWLRTTAEVTYERCSRNNDRPLLQTDDPLQTIKDLMDIRFPVYQSISRFAIDTAGLNISELANGIIDSASYHFSQSTESC